MPFLWIFFSNVYLSHVLSEVFRLAAWEEAACGSTSDYKKSEPRPGTSSVRNFLPSRESCRANSQLACYLSGTRGYQWPGLMQTSCISMRNTVNTTVNALIKQKGSRAGAGHRKKPAVETMHQRTWSPALVGVAKSSPLIATTNKVLLMLDATIQVSCWRKSLVLLPRAENNGGDLTCRTCPLTQIQLLQSISLRFVARNKHHTPGFMLKPILFILCEQPRWWDRRHPEQNLEQYCIGV